MGTEGVDYSYGRPGGAALKKAGKLFAARYLSHSAKKNLTRAEADDLAASLVSSVVVWETVANRAADGRIAGVDDAQQAAVQARGCGMPDSRPVYFAVDWDAAPAIVEAYFRGVASVIGVQRTGVYGGYKVVKYLMDKGLVSWIWQTSAWSAGKWDSRAAIRQYAQTVTINGVQCDRDTAQRADYGQWMPGKVPAESEADMSEWTDKLTLKKGSVWGSATADQTFTAGDWLTNTNGKAEKTYDLVKTLSVKVDDLADKVAKPPQIDYAKLAAALLTAIKEA